MVSYGQYCPVARAAEILGDRWTLLVVRELLNGAGGFNEVERGLPGISRSVLAQRLRALERAGILERRTSAGGRTLGYRLTPAGRDLRAVVGAAGEWAATWAFTDPGPDELDPDLLIAWMARHVDHAALPPGRIVIQFDLLAPRRRFWLVMEPEEVSVCLHHPGFTPDLTVAAATEALYRVYFGRTTLREALRAGEVALQGPTRLQRAFGGWFTGSSFAPAVRAAPQRRRAVEDAVAPVHLVVIERARPAVSGR